MKKNITLVFDDFIIERLKKWADLSGESMSGFARKAVIRRINAFETGDEVCEYIEAWDKVS